MKVLVVGSDLRARRIAEQLCAESSVQLHVCGFLDDDPSEIDLGTLGARYLGKLSDLRDLALKHHAECVVYGLPRSMLGSPSTSNLIATSGLLGIDVTIPFDALEALPARVSPGRIAGLRGITISPRSHQPFWKLVVKRSLDVGVAGLALLLTLPISIASMIAIKLDSDGPIFFTQERVGRFGRPFRFYKFRTMRTGAESDRAMLQAGNEQLGPVFKIRDDPRITRVGRLLRRFSIDELPQLINVVLGDMSIVGPRPPLPSEVAEYEIDQRARLSMRPGLTCLWQISGRNEIQFGDWVKLDLEYIDRWSLLLDLEIMLHTVPAVLSGRGAS